MRVRTLFLYLIGNRQAILDIAADRRAIWVGLLFVLSAGFAREYDMEDLRREPWHLLLPLGASLVAGSLLFLVACGKTLFAEARLFFSSYRAFLTLFWMTAPLAWLYAIPYERFLSPPDAVRANLYTLGLVALWRVVLMIRVVSVITSIHPVAASFLVLAFADAVALIAIFQVPMPVIAIMGGVRLTDTERAVQGTTMLVRMVGILAAPVVGIGALIVLSIVEPVWKAATGATRTSRGLWALGIVSVAVWLPILPWMQGAPQRRARAERALKSGSITEGLDLMSAHAASDFPAGWDPPPRVGYGEKRPDLLDVMEQIVSRPVAPWVRAVYVEKFQSFLGEEHAFFDYNNDKNKHGTVLARTVGVLRRLPEGPTIAVVHRRYVEDLLKRGANLPAEDRDSLTEMLNLARAADRPGQK